LRNTGLEHVEDCCHACYMPSWHDALTQGQIHISTLL